MDIFETFAGHEEVLFGSDPTSGLRAIIAIHSTTLGPALGGTRFFAYPSESDAITDVMRLSEGMSYKAAVASLDLGGGKAVIIGDPREIKSERLFRAYGRLIDSLGGRYVTAEDVGTTTADMELIARETRHVTGLPRARGGSGDPSPATALGVFHAMRAASASLWGDPNLRGKRVAVQGVGKVGGALVELLVDAGATVAIADINTTEVARLVEVHGVSSVAPDEILFTECDILAPCAMGAVLSEASIPLLSCDAVVGSANNQLAEDKDAERLADRDIVYVPDFVANAGGIINIADEAAGRNYSWDRAIEVVKRIETTVESILDRASVHSTTPHAAATAIATERIASVASLPMPPLQKGAHR